MSGISRLVNLGAAGAGGDAGWGLEVTNAGVFRKGDADSTSLVFGYGNSNVAQVLSYDHDGNQNWQKNLGNSIGYTPTLENIVIANGIHVLVWMNNATGITKLNTNGTVAINWKEGNAQPPTAAHENLCTDGSNLYFMERSGSQAILTKYTSNYSVSWGSQNSYMASYYGVAPYADSTGTLYVANVRNSDNKAVVARFNNFNGQVYLWQRAYDGPSGSRGAIIYDIAADSNYDAIIVGKYEDAYYTNQFFVAKLNFTTGNVTWSKEFNYGGYYSYPSVTVDKGTDDIYVHQSVSSLNYNDILKFNSSGTLQWVNRITGYNGDNRNFIKVPYNNAGYLFVGFRGSSSDSFAVCRIPTDSGVSAGTYGGFTFSYPSLSISNANLTAESSTVTWSDYNSGNPNFGNTTVTNSTNGSKTLTEF